MAKVQTPQTLPALSRLLQRHGKRALLVPGADSGIRVETSRPVIDVSGLRGFANVTRKGRQISIGTGASFGHVLREISGENGLLLQALSMLASPLIRNRLAVLSALETDSEYFDLATPLVTLGARVRIQSGVRSRAMSIGDFLVAAAEGLKAGEFPSMVEFRALEEEWRVGFFRVSAEGGKSSVSASVRTRLRRNVAVDPEIVVSSSTIIPVPSPEASRQMARKPLTDNNIKMISETAAAEMLEIAEIDEDPYESSLIAVAVSRALKRIAETIQL